MKRDIARNQMVFHSSAANKDQCGHLVTNGDPHDRVSRLPFTLADKDGDPSVWNLLVEQNDTAWYSPHTQTYFDVVFEKPVQVAYYRMFAALHGRHKKPLEWRLCASNDGVTFTELDYQKHDVTERGYVKAQGYTYITPEPILPVQNKGAFTQFRFEVLDTNGDEGVSLGEFDLIGTDNKTLLRRTDHHFDQCWISGGNEEEYLVLDLGAMSDIEEILLEWGEDYAAAYDLLSSVDGEAWTTCHTVQNGQGGTERFSLSLRARWLKLCMHRATGAHYVLRRWCVMGDNDLVPLSSSWKLIRATETQANGQDISTPDFDDTAWMPAVLPGTVLGTYMTAGAVCEYNNDVNYLQHSDAFFTADWWYRYTFTVDTAKKGQHVWLHFDAINWKADVYVNGEFVGDIAGAFIRGTFDITNLVRFDKVNAVAVLVQCNFFPVF